MSTPRKTLTVQLMEANAHIAALEKQLTAATAPPVKQNHKRIPVSHANHDLYRQACANARAAAMSSGKCVKVTF